MWVGAQGRYMARCREHMCMRLPARACAGSYRYTTCFPKQHGNSTLQVGTWAPSHTSHTFSCTSCDAPMHAGLCEGKYVTARQSICQSGHMHTLPYTPHDAAMCAASGKLNQEHAHCPLPQALHASAHACNPRVDSVQAAGRSGTEQHLLEAKLEEAHKVGHAEDEKSMCACTHEHTCAVARTHACLHACNPQLTLPSSSNTQSHTVTRSAVRCTHVCTHCRMQHHETLS